MAGSVVEDYLAAFGEMVDIFKLSGKQAMMMSDDSLKAFISACKNHQVMVAVGNPVMDVALTGGRALPLHAAGVDRKRPEEQK